MALGWTQPLTKISTGNLPGRKRRPARRADNLAAICGMSENVGASTSRNPKGLPACTGITFHWSVTSYLTQYSPTPLNLLLRR
jgi:hypothetical protein